eukprot:8215301-Heterocapsa_arctica.AAC.1
MQIGRATDQRRREDGHLRCNCERSGSKATTCPCRSSSSTRRSLDSPGRRRVHRVSPRASTS